LTNFCFVSHAPIATFGKLTAVASLALFHRVETKTQTKETARLQEASREIWGRTAKWSFGPSVKAYPGNLPDRRGIEFTTDIEPNPNSAPNEARWYLNVTAGVVLRQANGEDFACIVAASVKNMQP
jgi:hypothetical protein